MTLGLSLSDLSALMLNMTKWMQKPSEVIMYSLQPIRSQEDYKASLKEIEHLFEAPQGTPEFDRLEILVTLVEAYENKHEPIVMPDPIEAILYYLESRGLTQQHSVRERQPEMSGDFMKMENNQELEDELRPEYNFSKMKGGVRGKYVERYRAGTNVVLLVLD